MAEEKLSEETYLGDAVYASFDGYQIRLRTGDGNNQAIYLEPEVYAALVRYVDSLRQGEQEPEEPEDDTDPYTAVGESPFGLPGGGTSL